MSYCNMSSILEEEDHAVNSKFSSLGVSQPSARRWNLGPQQGEGLQSGAAQGLDRLESPWICLGDTLTAQLGSIK